MHLRLQDAVTHVRSPAYIGASLSHPLTSAAPAGLEVHNCSTPKPVNRSAAALVANKRFKCTECGKCCTGSGEVYVNMAECSAIASHLRIPLDHFLETYCEQSANALGGRQLKSKDTLDKVLRCFCCCDKMVFPEGCPQTSQQ